MHLPMLCHKLSRSLSDLLSMPGPGGAGQNPVPPAREGQVQRHIFVLPLVLDLATGFGRFAFACVRLASTGILFCFVCLVIDNIALTNSTHLKQKCPRRRGLQYPQVPLASVLIIVLHIFVARIIS